MYVYSRDDSNNVLFRVSTIRWNLQLVKNCYFSEYNDFIWKWANKYT